MQTEEIVGGPSAIGGLAAPRLQEPAADFERFTPPGFTDALRPVILKLRQRLCEGGGGRYAFIGFYISREPFKMFKTFKRYTFYVVGYVLNVLNVLNGCRDIDILECPPTHFSAPVPWGLPPSRDEGDRRSGHRRARSTRPLRASQIRFCGAGPRE